MGKHEAILFVQSLRERQAVFRNGLRVVQKLIDDASDTPPHLYILRNRVVNRAVLFQERRAVGRILSDGTEKLQYRKVDSKVAD